MGRNKKLQEIDLSLNSLVVFRKLLTHEVILPLRALLDTETMDPMIQLRQYTEFISRLYAHSTNLTEYVFRLICEDDNFYVRAVARGEEPDEMLRACVQNELVILQRLARIRPHELQKEVSYYGVLPEWNTADIDFGAEYHARMREIGKYGFGQFARHTVFTVQEGRLVPVLHPDPASLAELYGYAAERQRVIDNTAALLRGGRAQDILLFGGTGTGKSVTVKAAANSFAAEGLRLIEITQEQLSQIPAVIEAVYENPLKFILYIDDLDLHADDSGLRTLKASLEGSAASRAGNTVIYATSSAGTDADPERLPEPMRGLAARFGLRIGFGAQQQAEYLDFVEKYAAQAGLKTDPETLRHLAEDYAAQHGGYSPRTAKQMIEQLGNG